MKIGRMIMKGCLPLMAVFFVCSAYAKSPQKIAPTTVGIEPKQFMLMYDSLMTSDLTEIHHLVVMVDGKIAGELHPAPFKVEHKHTLYSVSKTFVAVAVGLAVDDGLLNVEDAFVKFFPEYINDEIDVRLRDIKIKDMLTMQSGFKTNGGMRNSQEKWVEYYMTRPLVADPGTRYSYDSIETYLLSALVQKVTGKNVLELLNERIFGPMGISDVEWEMSPEGIVTGGWGIYLSSHSQALFGQLLLQKGNWEGKQLISSEWLNEMMYPHVVRDANDYGYQIWLCEYAGAWRADGAMGQYIIIVPQKNMVVVLNQCSRSKGFPERSNIWHTVVKNAINCAIDANPAELKELAEYENNASLPVLEGGSESDIAKKYNGKTFTLENNKLGWKSVKFNMNKGGYSLEVVDAQDKRSSIQLGYKEWITSQLVGYPHYSISAKNRFSGLAGPFYTGSCYAWVGNELHAKIHYVNWISALKLVVKFDGNSIHIDGQENFTAKPFEIKGKKK